MDFYPELSGTDLLSNPVNLEAIQLHEHGFLRALGLIDLSVENSGIKTHQKYDIILFFFFKYFWAGTYTCPILGPLIPLLWISGDVSSGFQSHSGLPYSHCGGEHNVRSLRSTSGGTCCQPLDGQHCRAPTGFILLAPVRLKPVIKRS